MESRSVVGGCEDDWQERYRRGDTPWEKGLAHPALKEWLKRNPIAGRVLVPGCGTGHDARALAAAGAEVVAIDVAPLAIAAAKTFPPSPKISYILGNFFDLPPLKERFDWIFEHTFLCAIERERRREYVQRVAALLKSGGRLLAIFFLDPDKEEDGPPYGCSIQELDSLFSPHFRLVSQSENIPTYEGREGREILRLLLRD